MFLDLFEIYAPQNNGSISIFENMQLERIEDFRIGSLNYYIFKIDNQYYMCSGFYDSWSTPSLDEDNLKEFFEVVPGERIVKGWRQKDLPSLFYADY